MKNPPPLSQRSPEPQRGSDHSAQGCEERATLGKSPKHSPNPERVASPGRLSDRKLRVFERLANATIHELVFACHHAEDDQLQDCGDSLATCSLNLDQLQSLLAHAERRLARHSLGVGGSAKHDDNPARDYQSRGGMLSPHP